MKKVFNILLLNLFASLSLMAQVDKHIDPSEFRHYHNLKIARHKKTTFSNTTSTQAFRLGTEMLQECNNVENDEQDVAVQVELRQNGALGVFGDSLDGLDVLTTKAERDQVIGQNSAFFYVVTEMAYVPGYTVIGDAVTIPSSSAILRTTSDQFDLAYTMVHEFGHSRGLYHRDSSLIPDVGKPIMTGPHPAVAFNYNEVNLAEAEKYHIGGTANGKNRPVDILFVIDVTGSMTQEIQGVKDAIKRKVDELAGQTKCGKVYQLVTFRDNVTVYDPTTDQALIKQQVDALSASGGGDCPEASVEALKQSYDLVKDGGIIFTATDASPRSGTEADKATVEAACKARNVKISVMLTGDCISGVASASGGFDPISDNGDGAGIGPSAGVALSAIREFSTLANATGGIFCYFPEINGGSATTKKQFENIVYNLLSSATEPALVFIDPKTIYRGATTTMVLQGSNTHFGSGSVLTFSHPDVVVNSVQIMNKTNLIATVSVGAGVPLGLYNVTVTTGDELAEGDGIFNVATTPTSQLVTAIAPSIGERGKSLLVDISGVNTSWTNASIINVGAGITVSETEAVSPTQLRARLTISSTAIAGFRNVTVTTGSQVVSENVPGPFLVVDPPSYTPIYATAVSRYLPGKTKSQDPILPDFTNSAKALGAPEGSAGGDVDFVSLGFGGEIVLSFDQPIQNGYGDDLKIHETSVGQTCAGYPERADVFASQNGCDFIYLGGVCTNGGTLDLGVLKSAQYIKILDASVRTDFSDADANGFDVNSLEAMNGYGSDLNYDLTGGSLSQVVAYLPGTCKNGQPVPADRRLASNAIGYPSGSGVTFVTLGFGGTFIGKFDYAVFNQTSSKDLTVYETTYFNIGCTNYPEKARVYVSKFGNDWVEITPGLCQDGAIELGSLGWIQYVKLVDNSPIGFSLFNGAADGYDLDAITIPNYCSSAASRRAVEEDNGGYFGELGFEVVLSPVPVESKLMVNALGVSAGEKISFEVYDITGKCVLKHEGHFVEENPMIELDCSGLGRGMYLLKTSSQNMVLKQRFLK